jgi:flagellar biosynthesis regulator FlaF
MWILLRNTTYRANKTASNDLSIEKVMNLSAEELELPKHESLERIYERIEWEIKGWNWYDQKLWKIYKDERKPMRQIADETGISLKSIFLTIKSCKERIRQSVGDDYTDFLNEEFELI